MSGARRRISLDCNKVTHLPGQSRCAARVREVGSARLPAPSAQSPTPRVGPVALWPIVRNAEYDDGCLMLIAIRPIVATATVALTGCWHAPVATVQPSGA